MSKFWTWWIFKNQAITVLTRVFWKVYVPCVQAFIKRVVAWLHTPTAFILEAEKHNKNKTKTTNNRKTQLKTPCLSSQNILRGSQCPVFLRHGTLAFPNRRNLMFEKQKHLVKLQQNTSFSPATFNSKKPIKIWLCDAGRKLLSRVLFFSPFFIARSFQIVRSKKPLLAIFAVPFGLAVG